MFKGSTSLSLTDASPASGAPLVSAKGASALFGSSSAGVSVTDDSSAGDVSVDTSPSGPPAACTNVASDMNNRPATATEATPTDKRRIP